MVDSTRSADLRAQIAQGGVKFHNGAETAAEDVRSTFERVIKTAGLDALPASARDSVVDAPNVGG